MKQLMKNKYLLLFTSFLLAIFSFSQTYEVKNIKLNKSNSKGALYKATDQDGLIYATGYKSWLGFSKKKYLKVIDPMAEKVLKDIPFKYDEINNQGYNLYGLTMLNKKPVLIASNEKDNNYYAFNLDRNLKVSNSYKIGEIPVCEDFIYREKKIKQFRSEVIHHQSKNKINTFFSNVSCPTDKGISIRSIVTDEAGSELTSYKFTLDTKMSIDKSKLFTYNENKAYYFISANDTKNEGQGSPQNKLFAINKGIPTEVNLKIREELILTDLKMIQNDNELFVTGHFNSNETNELRGVFTAKMNVENDKLENFKAYYFDYKFSHSDSKEIIEYDQILNNSVSLLKNYQLIDYFQTNDGSTVYFSQQKEVSHEVRTAHSQGGPSRKITTSYYHYKDLIVTKIDKNGKMVRIKKIPLNQVTIDYDPGKGFVASHRQNDIILLHLSSKLRSDKINEIKHPENHRVSKKDKTYDRLDITEIKANGTIKNRKAIQLKNTKGSFNPKNVSVNHEDKTFILLNQNKGFFSSKKKITITKISF